jgi:hypothetical protein
MREIRIILPLVDNDGRDLSHDIEIALKLICATFGGYTACDARGGYIMADGALKQEPVLIVDVATDVDYAAAWFRGFFKTWLSFTKQESFYLRDTEGHVSLITRETPNV